MDARKKDLLIGSGALDVLLEALPADKASTLLDRLGISGNLDAAISKAVENSDARWRDSANARWFAAAHSEVLEPWRLMFRSARIADHHVQLELFCKGNALLTQTFRGEAASWSLYVGSRQIGFDEQGLAEIDAATVESIAEQAGLAPLFTEWKRLKGVLETLKRFGEALDSVQRSAVRTIAVAAAEMGKSFQEVAQWLYHGAPQLVPVHARAVSGEPLSGALGVVVTDLAVTPTGELHVGIAWVGSAPTVVNVVSVRVDGKPCAPSRVEWSAQDYASLELSGLDLDDEAKAAASWEASTNTLCLVFTDPGSGTGTAPDRP